MRTSNEFKFHIAAFHHAHEAYLVPDLLRQVYGDEPPVIAIFATNARYKREAYRGSEFAATILTEEGFDVAFKSDHPVLNSRYLAYEAAQGHHYGLNYTKALASITTIPAKATGLDHRLGYVREGYDADLVVWDSFPLALGATPKQTYIDGIAQILSPHSVSKPAEAQEISKAGKWKEEAAEALLTRGDPDLRAKKTTKNIIFTNVADNFLPAFSAKKASAVGTVIVEGGKIVCAGDCERTAGIDFEIVDLNGGSVAPGLVVTGGTLGLNEITQEKSTSDGVSSAAGEGDQANLQVAYDLLSDDSEYLEGLLVHAVDGAAFGGKNQL